MQIIIQGDARHIPLPNESVQCVVTSPPYWGLRDYKLKPMVWGGEAGCEHEWGNSIKATGVVQSNFSSSTLSSAEQQHKMSAIGDQTVFSSFCLRCSAWRGSLGLEPTPELYVQHIVEIFREVRRVMRKDGTVWLNLGDSYCGSWGNSGQRLELDGKSDGQRPKTTAYLARGGWDGRRDVPPNQKIIGLKPKDLVGIPWRVAFALQADSWWLRSDIIWAKPNPMPESVTDRPTKAHEYLFLLTKSAKYYYDAEAIKENGSAPITKMPDGWDTGPGAHGSYHRQGREKGAKVDKQRGHSRRHDGFNDRWDLMAKQEQCALRVNKRSVWTIATQPYPEAHFATFPKKLVEPCILAGSKESDLVLDPFAGSGTVGVVCARLNRRFIGLDLSGDYCQMAKKRIAPFAAQGHLAWQP